MSTVANKTPERGVLCYIQNMKKVFTISQIQEVAREILEEVKKPRRFTGAAIAALSGDLGAGKTTLTQAIARELGIKEQVISPTFIIMKFYDIDIYPWQKLVHIDAYRLKSKDELLRLGFAEIAKNPKNLIILEWPEQVDGLAGSDAVFVFLRHGRDTEERQLEIR